MPTPTPVKFIAVLAVLAAIATFVNGFYVIDAAFFWIPSALLALAGALSYFATSTILLALTLVASTTSVGLEIWLLVKQAYAPPSGVNVADIVFDSLAIAAGAAVVSTSLYGLDILSIFEPVIELLSNIPTALETKLFGSFAVVAAVGLFITDLIQGNLYYWWIASVPIFLAGVAAFFATSKVLTLTTIVLSGFGLGASIWQVVADAHLSTPLSLTWQALAIAGAAGVFLIELFVVGFFELFEPLIDTLSSFLSSPTPLFVKAIAFFATGSALGLFISDVVTATYSDYFWVDTAPLIVAGVFSYFATSKGLLWTTVILEAVGVGFSIWELVISSQSVQKIGGAGVDAIVWESLAIAGGAAVFVSSLWVIFFRKSSSSYVTLPTYGSSL